MRDDAVLTPTSKADIGIESNNHTLDGVAGFTVRHVIGFVARQVDVPDRNACDLHWYTATGWPS